MGKTSIVRASECTKILRFVQAFWLPLMWNLIQIVGRGFNAAVMTKDLNMLEWMHGNS